MVRYRPEGRHYHEAFYSDFLAAAENAEASGDLKQASEWYWALVVTSHGVRESMQCVVWHLPSEAPGFRQRRRIDRFLKENTLSWREHTERLDWLIASQESELAELEHARQAEQKRRREEARWRIPRIGHRSRRSPLAERLA
jgi:hypothetical protein